MLHSHDAVPGDLMVARDLVARLGRDVAHWVEQKSAREDSQPPPLAALERARAWHGYAEGLRPASFLHYTAPASIDSQTRVTVGGAGGEVAHSYYGTAADAAAQSLHSELLGGIENPVHSAQLLRAFAERIVRRHGPVPGVRDEAREALVQHVATVLGRTQEAGVYGSTLLDHFYVLERMRRWGTAAERNGVVSPLLTPSFQRAALALRPHQRRTNELHRRLTEFLVPQWKGVPYFPGEMPQEVRQRTSVRRVLRLTDCTDARAIEAVLASPDEWNYPFDSAILAGIWRRSAAQETSAADETVIRLAVWAPRSRTTPPNSTARLAHVVRASSPRRNLGQNRSKNQSRSHRPSLPSSSQHQPIAPPRTQLFSTQRPRPQVPRSQRSCCKPTPPAASGKAAPGHRYAIPDPDAKYDTSSRPDAERGLLTAGTVRYTGVHRSGRSRRRSPGPTSWRGHGRGAAGRCGTVDVGVDAAGSCRRRPPGACAAAWPPPPTPAAR